MYSLLLMCQRSNSFSATLYVKFKTAPFNPLGQSLPLPKHRALGDVSCVTPVMTAEIYVPVFSFCISGNTWEISIEYISLLISISLLIYI